MRKQFLIIIGLLLLPLSVARAAVFSDVSSAHENYDAINYLQNEGVIEGYEDNTFRPDQTVNRAEALKIILLGSDIVVPEIQPQEIFPDVIHGTWYAKFARKGKILNIVSGDGDTGLFRPGDTINLAEILKILLKANNIEAKDVSSHPYADVPPGAWFAPYFGFAKTAGLLDASSGDDVSPASPVTRGMMAELMYRLSQKGNVIEAGESSYYGAFFHGKTTANGETFDASGFTAAHRTLPFDTWLKVTNSENGKWVLVRVNDRGPYAHTETRIIDLAQAAFEAISPPSRGIIDVTLEKIGAPGPDTPRTGGPEDDDNSDAEAGAPAAEAVTGDVVVEEDDEEDELTADQLAANLFQEEFCSQKGNLRYHSQGSFDNITLDNELPNRFYEHEIVRISGAVQIESAETASVFIVDSSGNNTVFYGDLDSSNRFNVDIQFPDTGNFDIGVIPGAAGTSIVKSIAVLQDDCLVDVEPSTTSSSPAIELEIEAGDLVASWSPLSHNVHKVTLSQGNEEEVFITQNAEWSPDYKAFDAFDEGSVTLSVRSAKFTTKSLIELDTIEWGPEVKTTFTAALHGDYAVNAEEVDVDSLPTTFKKGNSFQASFTPKSAIRSEAAIILPNGLVEEIPLSGLNQSPTEDANGVEVYNPSENKLTVGYTTNLSGTHFLEINGADGLAAINIPVYEEGHYPLIPNLLDLTVREVQDLGNNITSLRAQMFDLINSDRGEFGLSPIALDNTLSSLAQSRANDMVSNKYFGHWDKDGNSANDLKNAYGIQPSVSENLAKDLNIELAQYGLMSSAIHRSNILSAEWSRVGIGIAQDTDGSYIFVQIFSTDPIDLDNLQELRDSIRGTINDNRSPGLSASATLNDVAQTWAVKMADDDFFDFTDNNGNTLIDSVRDAGENAALGTYILGNTSFSDLLEQIENNTQVQDSRWKNIGIGIKQDILGIIKVTLVYTE